ncbi:AP2 domain transcription factor AP2XII-5 [Babesia caballi]|uniref:AP2 domain transcription factor AP2XII-5 n=1 Tax=Babesia caballi TaxID=5871 RepID=A0AAV4LTP7_BABCB|nr:AP2 domain transcription factor AP2XII-5 [Babesia caballi]
MPETHRSDEDRRLMELVGRLPTVKGLHFDSAKRCWCVRVPREFCASGGCLYFSVSRCDCLHAWLSALNHWGRLVICHLRSPGAGCPCGVCRSVYEEGGEIKLSALDFTESFAEGVDATAVVPAARDCDDSSDFLFGRRDSVSPALCSCLGSLGNCVSPDNLRLPSRAKRFADDSPACWKFGENALSAPRSGDVHGLSSRGVRLLGTSAASRLEAFLNFPSGSFGLAAAEMDIGDDSGDSSKCHMTHMSGLPTTLRTATRSSSDGFCAVPEMAGAEDASPASGSECYSNPYVYGESWCIPARDSRAMPQLIYTPDSEVMKGASMLHRRMPMQIMHPAGALNTQFAASRDYGHLRCVPIVPDRMKYGTHRKMPQPNVERSNIWVAHRRPSDVLTSEYLPKRGHRSLQPTPRVMGTAIGLDQGLGYVSQPRDITVSSSGTASRSSSAVSSRPPTDVKSQAPTTQFSGSSEGSQSLPRDLERLEESSATDDEPAVERTRKTRRGRARQPPVVIAGTPSEVADSLRPWHKEVFWVPSISRWRTSFTDELGTRHTKTFTPSMFGGIKEAYDAAVGYKLAVDQICYANGISAAQRRMLRRSADMSLKQKRVPRRFDNDSPTNSSGATGGSSNALPAPTALSETEPSASTGSPEPPSEDRPQPQPSPQPSLQPSPQLQPQPQPEAPPQQPDPAPPAYDVGGLSAPIPGDLYK